MSEGYQKQGPGKPQGFPGLSSDPRKFSTGGRWALWNGRCETAGALCAPLRKDRRGPRRGGFQPPEKPSPHRGEGVTAYAVTDEGSFYPRPCPRGVLSCGAEPLSGILWMKTGGGKTRPYVKTRAARGKRRAHNAHPYAKTEGDPVGAASSRPKSLPPTGGDGVTAYAVTDEGSFYPRPCPRGVLSCGAEPLSGILWMKTGGGKTRPYVKTRAARGKRRAHNAHPYAKTEGDPVGGGFQPPEKPSPHRGGRCHGICRDG